MWRRVRRGRGLRGRVRWCGRCWRRRVRCGGRGVVAGELEAVEESGGSLDVEAAGGEGVDDDGEGDLDGFAVFEGGELDVLAGDEVAAGGIGVAVGGCGGGEGGGGSSTSGRR